MKFNWDNFTAEDFVNYCALVENNEIEGDNCIGNVTAGNLCFDLVTREIGANDMGLDYDLYVGGIDTGYRYSEKNNYPYDYQGGSCFIDSCISMTYDDFKVYAEKELETYIENEDKYYKDCSLIEKAYEDSIIW
jgi:hypothetical protein